MESEKRIARMTGFLFLLAFVTNIFAIVLSGSMDTAFITSADLLSQVSANSLQMKITVLLDLFSSASVIALAVLLYTSLRAQSPPIALLALGLWICEATVLAASKIGTFSLVLISEEYVSSLNAEASSFQILGLLFADASRRSFRIVQFFFSLGGMLFYYLFLQSRLIPRFVSSWGLVAVSLVFIEVSLDMLDYGFGLILFVPYMFFEPFIGVWLIVKGFTSSGAAVDPLEAAVAHAK